jgi:hypothetical protein
MLCSVFIKIVNRIAESRVTAGGALLSLLMGVFALLAADALNIPSF